MAPTRGNAISAYSPAFSKGAKIYGANVQSGVITSAHIADGTVLAADVGAGAITSAKIGAGAVVSAKIAANGVHASNISAKSITSAKIRAAFLSGSLVSGKKVFAVAHGLGVRPKFVVACAINSLTEASAAQNNSVSVAVSAATSANIYLVASGTQNAAHKYTAYVQL